MPEPDDRPSSRPAEATDGAAQPDAAAASGADAPGDGGSDAGARRPRGRRPAGTNTLQLGLAGVGLAAVIVLVAVVLAGSGDASDDVAAAVAQQADSISGPLPTAELRAMTCEADGDADGRFRCTTTVSSPVATAPIVVEYREGEPLTRRLSGSTITDAPRTGDDVARLLSADELALTGEEVRYGCAFSTGLGPGGAADASGPGGFRCASTAEPAEGEQRRERYAEFTDDGSVRRDFLLTE